MLLSSRGNDQTLLPPIIKDEKMNTKQNNSELNNIEDNLLTAIVDAILDAESYLQDATTNEWRQILRASCRKHKNTPNGPAPMVVASA